MGKSGGKKKKSNGNNNNNNNNRSSGHPSSSSSSNPRNNQHQQKKNHHRKNNNSHYNNNKETQSEDMAVLREQLDRVNLALKDVSADGNCFFRAICDQRDGSEIHHLDLRHEVCEYMEKHEEDFRPFVEDDEEWSAYLARMRKDGSWAGNMEVQACARLLKMRICVHRAGQPRWVLSPYFNDGESSNGEKKKNANNNNNEEIMDEDCAYHLAYDADRGCEHYNSARMVGTIDSDFPGGPISLRLITDAESEIFEIAQKTGFARDIGRVRRHFKKAIEEGRKLENMSHEEVIDFACESLMAELEKERKERDSLSFGGGGGENEDATEKNAQYANEFEDDFGGGGGWERAKTKREKRRGKNKSLLAEEYEALTL